MNRREFIALSAMGGALALKGAGETGTEPCRLLVTTSAPPRNPHPYANVDWTGVRRVNTTSHGHCVSQQMLDAYLKHGFGLMTISNYYPSAPTMPGKSITKDFYRFHQTHKVNPWGQALRKLHFRWDNW
jgi:hypothetical protein